MIFNRNKLFTLLVVLVVITMSLWFTGSETAKSDRLAFYSLVTPSGQTAGLNDSSEKNFGSVKSTNNEGNITNQLSLELINSLSAAKNPENITIDDFNKILGNVVTPVGSGPVSAKRASISDLNIFDNADDKFYLDYLTSVIEAVMNNFYDDLGKEATFFYATFNETNESKLIEYETKLEKASLVYRKIADELLAINIPASEASEHLEAVNAFSDLSVTTRIFKLGIRDPLRGIQAIRSYYSAARVLDSLSN